MPKKTDSDQQSRTTEDSTSDDASDSEVCPASTGLKKPGRYAHELGLGPGLAIVLIAGVMVLIYGAVGLAAVATFP